MRLSMRSAEARGILGCRKIWGNNPNPNLALLQLLGLAGARLQQLQALQTNETYRQRTRQQESLRPSQLFPYSPKRWSPCTTLPAGKSARTGYAGPEPLLNLSTEHRTDLCLAYSSPLRLSRPSLAAHSRTQSPVLLRRPTHLRSTHRVRTRRSLFSTPPKVKERQDH